MYGMIEGTVHVKLYELGGLWRAPVMMIGHSKVRPFQIGEPISFVHNLQECEIVECNA